MSKTGVWDTSTYTRIFPGSASPLSYSNQMNRYCGLPIVSVWRVNRSGLIVSTITANSSVRVSCGWRRWCRDAGRAECRARAASPTTPRKNRRLERAGAKTLPHHVGSAVEESGAGLHFELTRSFDSTIALSLNPNRHACARINVSRSTGNGPV